MRKPIIIIMVMLCAIVSAMAQSAKYQAYISKYRDIAISQMREHNIPASITMAQGLLESGAGTSLLAVKGHNHFGIKAHHDWTGPVMLRDDDAPNEKFRVYAHDEQSYEDHSLFLRRGRRYASLFTLPVTDYKGWAYGLKAAGYATSPTYAAKLIQIIEDYNLTELDQAALGKKHHARPVQTVTTPAVPQALSHGQHNISYNNRNYYIVARVGDTFESLAKEYGVSARKLRRNNEVDKHHQLKAGDIVYFEKKQKRADKIYKKKYHVLQAGESLYGISQKYGMRLKTLYSINKLEPGYAPKVGDRIRLR
ncbi:MAG: glucosaminidase domain-containing protein [Bacteroidaceae bacterium]|nr:glucosaminidase domain-containing protein [Bacteroidaceae bacterium]